MKRDLHAEVTAQLLRELESGTPPWIQPWSVTSINQPVSKGGHGTTVHPSRLNRRESLHRRLPTPPAPSRSLLQKLTSVLLCTEFSINSVLRHAGYVTNWIETLIAEPRAKRRLDRLPARPGRPDATPSIQSAEHTGGPHVRVTKMDSGSDRADVIRSLMVKVHSPVHLGVEGLRFIRQSTSVSKTTTFPAGGLGSCIRA